MNSFHSKVQPVNRSSVYTTTIIMINSLLYFVVVSLCIKLFISLNAVINLHAISLKKQFNSVSISEIVECTKKQKKKLSKKRNRLYATNIRGKVKNSDKKLYIIRLSWSCKLKTPENSQLSIHLFQSHGFCVLYL